MQSSRRAQENLAIFVLAKNAIDFGTHFGAAIVGSDGLDAIVGPFVHAYLHLVQVRMGRGPYEVDRREGPPANSLYGFRG